MGNHEAQKRGLAGHAVGGSSADAGWREHQESEERAVLTAVIEDIAKGRGAAPLPRQAATMADEPRLPPDETEGDEDEVPHEQVDH